MEISYKNITFSILIASFINMKQKFLRAHLPPSKQTPSSPQKHRGQIDIAKFEHPSRLNLSNLIFAFTLKISRYFLAKNKFF